MTDAIKRAEEKARSLVETEVREAEGVRIYRTRQPSAHEIAVAILDARNEGLEEIAALADAHSDFCKQEARSGGSQDLEERAVGASYLAAKARALKVKP